MEAAWGGRLAKGAKKAYGALNSRKTQNGGIDEKLNRGGSGPFVTGDAPLGLKNSGKLPFPPKIRASKKTTGGEGTTTHPNAPCSELRVKKAPWGGKGSKTKTPSLVAGIRTTVLLQANGGARIRAEAGGNERVGEQKADAGPSPGNKGKRQTDQRVLGDGRRPD